MLYYLTERAARTMRELGLECKRLRVRIRYSDFANEATAQSLAHSTAYDKDLFEVARRLLHRLFTRRVSLRLIGVTLSRFSPAVGHQMDIFEEDRNARLENLYACLDELRRRFGHSIVVANGSLDLLGKLKRDPYGYVLRTPCLTK